MNANSESREEAGEGWYFYGVLRRTEAWPLGRQTARVEGGELIKVRYRDLEALVREVPFEVPPLDDARVHEHQRTVERMMRRTTVLPASYGIVFRGRDPLIRFLQDQYVALDEGLGFLEGHWELRLHIEPKTPAADAPELEDVAVQIYSELRNTARAAVPSRRTDDRLLTAAFLVERSGWIDFVERIEDLAEPQHELKLDVTGPWPPYDFVKMIA